MSESHRSVFAVPADHPALAGHFPGSSVVPGVVLLDLVLKAAELWQQRPVSVSGLRQVKFHARLLPAQRADVTLERRDGELRFHVTREGLLIAQGTFVTGAAPQTYAAPRLP